MTTLESEWVKSRWIKSRWVKSEWIKLVSVRSTWWCLGTAAVLVPVFAVLTALATDAVEAAAQPKAGLAADDAFDPLRPLSGVLLAQFAFGVLGVLTITSEHSTGQIRTSLLAVPYRRRLLVAKLAVLLAVVAAVASLLTFGTFFLSQAVYPDGLGIALGDGGAWKALLGMIAYTVFIAAFGFAVGAALRGTGAAITVFMAVTFVVMSAVPAVLPNSAGDTASHYTFLGLADSLTTLQPDPQPGMPVAALLLAAYAVVALAPALLLTERRDA
ncbi:ABC transporter permease subunit [Streptodolium elevatio]|uniref:ABC transporter permease subunit n=1 Tax=Streptodolium elevatio TaxID=3157996 RepID=A0ABV3DDB8_9ACTN